MVLVYTLLVTVVSSVAAQGQVDRGVGRTEAKLVGPASAGPKNSYPDPDWHAPWKGLPELLAVLGTVPEGAAILDAARGKDANFLDHIHRGDASYTESTFARSYSLLDGRERIELRHEITLNRRLPLGEAVVDLAHELVHFTEKAMLDPYKPGFELKEFVKRGIEGQGGELVALKGECEVAWSLGKKYEFYPPHRLCTPYHQKTGFNEAKARRDYYALGNWMKTASAELMQAAPELTDEPVVFTSSYARKPYPIALAEEFAATREIACANNRKKYRLIAAQAEDGRIPAEENLLSQERRRLKTYDRLYCRPDKK